MAKWGVVRGGAFTGEFLWFPDGVNDPPKPDPAAELRPVQIEGWVSGYDGLILGLEGPSFVVTAEKIREIYDLQFLPTARAGMRRRVNEQAEAARHRFITPGDGKAMVYLEKRNQAIDLLANHSPENPPPAGKYLLLESGIGVFGADVFENAQTVLARSNLWTVVAAQIDAIEANLVAQIEAAPTDGHAFSFLQDAEEMFGGVGT